MNIFLMNENIWCDRGPTATFTGPPYDLGFQENTGSAAPKQRLLGVFVLNRVSRCRGALSIQDNLRWIDLAHYKISNLITKGSLFTSSLPTSS
jgi:hypothetical protein